MKSKINKNNPFTKELNKWKKGFNFKSLTYDEFLENIPPNEKVSVQVKEDGELALCDYDGKRALFASLEGRIREDLPVLKEIAAALKRRGIKSATIIGELVGVRKGKTLPFNETLSVIRTPVDEREIHFFPFELQSSDGERFKEIDYPQSFNNLKKWFKSAEFVHPVKSFQVVKNRIPSIWEREVVNGESEGLVIRSKTLGNIKVKPEFGLDLAVGFVQKSEANPNHMGALGLFFRDPQGQYLHAGKVGTGFKQRDRKEWLVWAKKNKIDEDNKNIWVDPEKGNRVVSINYGRLNFKDVDAYNYKDGTWDKLDKKLPAVTLSKPSFQGIRDDKNVKDKADTRLEQIPNWKEEQKKVGQPQPTPYPPDSVLPQSGDTPTFPSIDKLKRCISKAIEIDPTLNLREAINLCVDNPWPSDLEVELEGVETMRPLKLKDGTEIPYNSIEYDYDSHTFIVDGTSIPGEKVVGGEEKRDSFTALFEEHLAQDIVDRTFEMWREGYSIREIAEVLNVAPCDVRAFLGLPARRSQTQFGVGDYVNIVRVKDQSGDIPPKVETSGYIKEVLGNDQYTVLSKNVLHHVDGKNLIVKSVLHAQVTEGKLADLRKALEEKASDVFDQLADIAFEKDDIAAERAFNELSQQVQLEGSEAWQETVGDIIDEMEHELDDLENYPVEERADAFLSDLGYYFLFAVLRLVPPELWDPYVQLAEDLLEDLEMDDFKQYIPKEVFEEKELKEDWQYEEEGFVAGTEAGEDVDPYMFSNDQELLEFGDEMAKQLLYSNLILKELSSEQKTSWHDGFMEGFMQSAPTQAELEEEMGEMLELEMGAQSGTPYPPDQRMPLVQDAFPVPRMKHEKKVLKVIRRDSDKPLALQDVEVIPATPTCVVSGGNKMDIVALLRKTSRQLRIIQNEKEAERPWSAEKFDSCVEGVMKNDPSLSKEDARAICGEEMKESTT